jgi:prophage regulatory protein
MADVTAGAILRKAEVLTRTRKSETSLYRDMDAGTFPRPIKIGPRAVGWLESEVNEWLAERIAERDQRGAA